MLYLLYLRMMCRSGEGTQNFGVKFYYRVTMSLQFDQKNFVKMRDETIGIAVSETEFNRDQRCHHHARNVSRFNGMCTCGMGNAFPVNRETTRF
jgi:hypothetical protein